jgi:hypothetical protein
VNLTLKDYEDGVTRDLTDDLGFPWEERDSDL